MFITALIEKRGLHLLKTLIKDVGGCALTESCSGSGIDKVTFLSRLRKMGATEHEFIAVEMKDLNIHVSRRLKKKTSPCADYKNFRSR